MESVIKFTLSEMCDLVASLEAARMYYEESAEKSYHQENIEYFRKRERETVALLNQIRLQQHGLYSTKE